MATWFDIIRACCPHGKPDLIKTMADSMPVLIDKHQINTPIRQCHFLAQMAQECDGFRTMTEYASGADYEGRKDLGNTQSGDGKRFKGRGYPQLTGRYNYEKYGNILGVDLVKNPERAADPETSARIAGAYWEDHRLNAKADRDDLRGVTRKVNGGLNGIQTRETYLTRFKACMGGQPNPNVINDPPMAQEQVRTLQQRLQDLGYPLVGTPDGQIGPMTISAISAFQAEHGLPVTGAFDKATVDAMWSAEKRVLPDERTHGTPPPSAPTKGAMGGAIGAGGAGLIAIGNWLMEQLQGFGGQWASIKSALGPFGDIPDVINDHWGILVIGFAVYVAYQARQIRKEQVDAYRTGRTL